MFGWAPWAGGAGVSVAPSRYTATPCDITRGWKLPGPQTEKVVIKKLNPNVSKIENYISQFITLVFAGNRIYLFRLGKIGTKGRRIPKHYIQADRYIKETAS